MYTNSSSGITDNHTLIFVVVLIVNGLVVITIRIPIYITLDKMHQYCLCAVGSNQVPTNHKSVIRRQALNSNKHVVAHKSPPSIYYEPRWQ